MKMNWGNSIALAFILFATFILYFVVRAFNEDFDLVSETYYKDEINYQQRMNDQANLLNSGVEIDIQQGDKNIVFSYPESFKNAKGEIHFFHVSRTIFDRRFDIETGTDGHQLIAKSEIVKGNYTLKLDWENEGKTYYQEADIYIR
jgi:hypothetical protein